MKSCLKRNQVHLHVSNSNSKDEKITYACFRLLCTLTIIFGFSYLLTITGISAYGSPQSVSMVIPSDSTNKTISSNLYNTRAT